MKQVLARVALAILLVSGLSSPASARDTIAQTTGQGLVAFSTEEGMVRLARSDAKVDFPALANQFEAQSNSAFCGPTTASMVLNALQTRSSALPRDRTRLQPGDMRHLPPTVDPLIPRFTQDNVFAKGAKTRAQIMGEPMRVNGKIVQDFGIQLRQLEGLFKAQGTHTRLVIVDDKLNEAGIRNDITDNLRRVGDYVVVNYRREAAGQKGGGHISPLAAYDRESDSFLILDVNPAVSGWVWMPAASLINGMRTFDTVENRGYLHAGQ